MNNLKIFAIFLSVLFILIMIEAFYISSIMIDQKAKVKVTKLLGMPDLAISTETHFIRDRSLTDMFEIFPLGGSLLPYFPSEFVYAPARRVK